MVLCISGCVEHGRVRVSDDEVTGAYSASFETGNEELILNSDRTYVQTFVSPNKTFTNRGTWKSSNPFLAGTQIELAGAVCSEDDHSPSPTRCFRNLVVHRKEGHVRLGLNESADWYYVKKQ